MGGALICFIFSPQISVERDGTVVRLESEDIAGDDIRMDAAFAMAYVNIAAEMQMAPSDGASPMSGIGAISSSFSSRMQNGEFHHEAA